MNRPRRLALVALALSGLCAGYPGEARGGDGGGRWTVRLSPAGDLYPRYVADPRRSQFSVVRMSVSDSEIAEAGDSRFGLRVGGRYGFIRLHTADDPDHGFQVDLEGGFLGQFDLDNSTDNIGWDGLYGLQFAWAHPGGIAVRVGFFHDSSHVGDEFAERTGRVRVDYTRQELLAGVSWRFAPRWRLYAEGGYGHDLRNEALMEPWRVEGGLEFEAPAMLWGRRAGLYAAADATLYQENGWRRNVTVQTGVLVPVRELSRTYRFGVEVYDGRSHIGEFFQEDERYVSFGFWFDL